MKQFRCIIFSASFPDYIQSDERHPDTYMLEAATPEDAMWECIKKLAERIIELEGDWLKGITTWQPSSGIVFVSGKACGVVFKV